MARDKEPRGRVDASATPGFGGSLGDLLRAQGLAVPVAAGTAAPGPAEAAGGAAGRPDGTGSARATPAVAAPEVAAPDVGFEPGRAGPLRLRRDRKQRHGKTVVLVEGLWPPPPVPTSAAAGARPQAAARPDPRAVPDEATVVALLRDLKKALGCGAVREADALVVQGDQLERVAEWLRGRGFRIR